MQLSAMLPARMFMESEKANEDARTLATCRAAGLAAVEIHGSLALEPRLDDVRRMLGDNGLALSCYIIATDFLVEDSGARVEAIAHAVQQLEQAALLGAPLVLLIPGRLKAAMTVVTAHRHIVEGLRRCLERAPRLGLTLTMENHGGQAATYGTSAQLRAICGAAGPEMRLTYDVGNFLLAGEDPLAALDQLAPLVAHAHMKDWEAAPPEDVAGAGGMRPHRGTMGLDGRRWLPVDLGTGVIDVRGAIARLAHHGYDGYLSLERGGPDFLDGVRSGATYLRTLIQI